MNKTAVTTFAISAVLAGSLAACSGGNTIAPPPSQAAPATTSAPAPQQYTADFGGSVTFTDGVKVSVSQPKALPATETAAGAVEGKVVAITITVTNGSKAPVNGSLVGFPKFSYGADNVEAQTVYDAGQHIGDSHLSTILPGETQTATVGFGVPAAGYGAVRVEVRPVNFTDQPAIFKGAVG